MTNIIPIALFGWMFVVLLLFSVMPPRRAVLVSIIGAWLFLPVASISFVGLPDLTKISVTNVAVLIGMILVDSGRILRFRPRWVDLPIVVWCTVPMVASLSNELGFYDGASAVLEQLVTWGIPYFIGRLYFDSFEALRDLAVALVIGGLIYVPLCAYEVRMSPQLHKIVYGFHPHQFIQSIRWGGYRPVVFMQHGLMVGMWMTCTTLVAWWLWLNGTRRRLFNVPLSVLLIIMVITTVLCKSTGALILLFLGMALLYATKVSRSPIPLFVAVALAPAYVAVRAQNLWTGEQLVQMASAVSEERAHSLEFRFENEAMVAEKAREKPWFGWGRWGRWRVFDEFGNDITTSDGMWIIALGSSGRVGLAAMLTMILLPVLLMIRRIPVRRWASPEVAPASALAVILVIYGLDMMVNAMLNPVFMLAAGGLSTLVMLAPRRSRRTALARAATVGAPRTVSST